MLLLVSLPCMFDQEKLELIKDSSGVYDVLGQTSQVLCAEGGGFICCVGGDGGGSFGRGCGRYVLYNIVLLTASLLSTTRLYYFRTPDSVV